MYRKEHIIVLMKEGLVVAAAAFQPAQEFIHACQLRKVWHLRPKYG